MSFTRRKIDLTFTLGKGAFGADGSDTVQLSGLRVSADITQYGGTSMSMASVRVYGAPLSVMNALTILGVSARQVREANTVTISAGDDQDGMAVCHRGVISECWIDGTDAPNVSLVVQSFTGLVDAIKPAPPTSYKGSVDAATVISGFAARMVPPRSVQNDGVTTRLSNPVYPGTLLDQVRAACTHANCNYLDDGIVIAIWPKNGARGGAVPLISADTGLVGYPVHTQAGIQIVTLFNPRLTFGGYVEVQSVLGDVSPGNAANGAANNRINGRWVIFGLSHNISSETPGGPWFTQIEGNAGVGRQIV